MTPMISTGLNRYAGKDLKVGDRFEVEDQHVRTLEVTRKAKLAGAKGEGQYETRAMTAGRGARPRKADQAQTQ